MTTPRPMSTSADPPRGCGPAWERPGARPASDKSTQGMSSGGVGTHAADQQEIRERRAAVHRHQFDVEAELPQGLGPLLGRPTGERDEAAAAQRHRDTVDPLAEREA